MSKKNIYKKKLDISFPLSRIKNILKQDPDNKLIKKNVLVMIEQATELFGEYVLKEMTKNITKKKKLQQNDLGKYLKKII